MHLLVKNDITEMQKISDSILCFGKDNNLDDKNINDLNLILEEIITNIIFYGYEDDIAHIIKVDISLDNHEIVIRVEDDGKPFNPLESSEPDIDLPLEEREIGGLGIFLVKSMTDKMDYSRVDGVNILELRKFR